MIQSLTAAQQTKKSLPATGTLQPTLNKPEKDNGILYLSASYTDKGGNNIKPMTNNEVVALRNSKIYVEGLKKKEKYTSEDKQGMRYLLAPKTTGWFVIDSVDLTGITNVTLNLVWENRLNRVIASSFTWMGLVVKTGSYYTARRRTSR
ncbi:hypothetical protein [Paraflavitalea speifideaquila]|uniref:hypothetical protein n=1 Tax=Paraflavitalea speifideaquila TaxID=3076558 RepID=UPI0028E215BA|nr:hypothetical protein [Paraflavitalea speifideiaquila]